MHHVKNLTIILSYCLALLLIFGLFGCGSDWLIIDDDDRIEVVDVKLELIESHPDPYRTFYYEKIGLCNLLSEI